jgi:hypothetical protein
MVQGQNAKRQPARREQKSRNSLEEPENEKNENGKENATQPAALYFPFGEIFFVGSSFFSTVPYRFAN